MAKIIDEVTKEANEAIRKAAKGSKMTFKVGTATMPTLKKGGYGVEMPKITGKEGVQMPKLADAKGIEMPNLAKMVSGKGYKGTKVGEMPTLEGYTKGAGIKMADMPSLKGAGKYAGEIPTLGESLKKLGKTKKEMPAPIIAADVPNVKETVTL
jgi:hypothetical protein